MSFEVLLWKPVSLVILGSESVFTLKATPFEIFLSFAYVLTNISVGFHPFAASTSHGHAEDAHVRSFSALKST